MRAPEVPVGRHVRARGRRSGIRGWTSSDVATGGIIGGIEALLAISFGGLVFAGALAPAAGTMIGMVLVSAAVLLVVVAHRTSLPDAVGSVQDASAAILAVITAGIVAELGPEHPGLVGTAIVAVVITTATAGAMLWMLGRFQLGQLARYVPLPVIGGFLAGTGWLLVSGGLALLAGDDLVLAAWATWTDPEVLLKLLPGVFLAVGLMIGLRRGVGGAFLPATALVAIVLFHLVAMLGPGLDAVRDDGWLLGPFPDGALWPPDPSLFADVHLAAIAGQGVAILTVAALSAVSLLLTVSGIELTTGADADLDQELRVAGSANLLVAVAGGLPGFQALSLTELVRRADANGRRVGLVAATVVLLAMVVGSSLIVLVPRFVVGGLLAFLGLTFLIDRPAPQAARLAVVGERIVVLELQGFLFFGTGHRLAEEVREILLADHGIRYLVLDLRRVTGADSTAMRSLERIARRVAATDATLVLAGLPAGRSRRLVLDPVLDRDEVRLAPDLDHAVEWCEDQLLAQERHADEVPDGSLVADLRAELGDDELVDRLLAVVEPVGVAAGTRVIRRGDTDHDLYLLEEGQLTVCLPGEDGPVRVRTMTAGTVIGEMGLELGAPRSADVVADTDARLLRLPAATLERLALEDPRLAAAVHRYLARLLARRLTTSLRTIEALER